MKYLTGLVLLLNESVEATTFNSLHYYSSLLCKAGRNYKQILTTILRTFLTAGVLQFRQANKERATRFCDSRPLKQ